MGKYIPLQDKLDEIEEQGKRLRRRLDYLKGERDFLVDMLLTRPTRDMEEYKRYKEIQNRQMCNHPKTKKTWKK